MQKAILLEAKLREIKGKAVAGLRRTGVMPAVVYGEGIASRNLSVDAKTFAKVYSQAGESTLVDLQVAGAAPIKVLIQDVAKHYLTMKPIHADFYQVSMTKKLTTEIPLKFIGESPAVKELGGVLVKNLQEVKVECLPQDLVHEIEVDLAFLKVFGDAIIISKIISPPGIRILNRQEETVVLAQAPRADEEVVAVPVTEKEAIEKIGSVADEKKAEKTKKEEEEKAGEKEKKK